ncbi:pseudaminic acid synthase [Clostridium magnum DSM 2767]|uniref:Pseudaminic acid synthase n=1 Tax=Clostridium magnum DSM 2767 TaxID=1121326 RepID=A0A161Y6X3_9CLOT|nr:pseudaminic acid synthase [Clostridium magnum DSM 2767]SHH95040.1 SAF domain-containing protein [Clostridium magnum DSM 2767]
MNLRTIPNLSETFNVLLSLFDHILGISVSVEAVTLAVKTVAKHFTLCRADGGPEAAFSLEPDELRQMVKSIREVEKALGGVSYELTEKMKNSREFSRSLFVTQDIKEGEKFTEENVRSIRPGFGMHPRYYYDIIGKEAKQNIEKGTPMNWNLVK